MARDNLGPQIVKYEKSLEEDPRSKVFAPLAEAYRKVGLLDNAFKTLKVGLRYNPDYLFGYLTLAQCYLDKDEFNLCYTTLKPLVAHNRDNLKLQKIFAESAEATENLEEALDTYKYLLYLHPKDQLIIEKVKKLENLLNEDVINYSTKEVPKFDIDELKVTPGNDKVLDDWVQLDLSKEDDPEEDVDALQEIKEHNTFNSQRDSRESPQESSDSWSVGNPNAFEDEEGEDDEDKFEVAPPPEDITPTVTHTLVDLYLEQGYFDKAKELLVKILELQPNNEETIRRLNELNSVLEEPENYEASHLDQVNRDIEEEDEGHVMLSAALDKATQDENIQLNQDDIASVNEDKITENKLESEVTEKIREEKEFATEVLYDFLDAAKKKSSRLLKNT